MASEAEQKVKEKWPDAYAEKAFTALNEVGWYIWKNGTAAGPLGLGDSPRNAWADAARRLEER